VTNYPIKMDKGEKSSAGRSQDTNSKRKKGKRDPECMDDDELSISSDEDSSISKEDIKDIVQKILLETMPTLIAEITKQVMAAMAPFAALLTRIETLEKQLGTAGGNPSHNVTNRKKNLLIYELPEPTTGKETPAELRHTLKDLASELGYAELDYDDAFRIGKATAKGLRPILLKLLRTRDKFDIFNAKKKLYLNAAGKPDKTKEYSNIYINDDLSPEERTKEKSLRDFMKQLRKGDPTIKGSVRNGKLITRKGGIASTRYAAQPDGTVTPEASI
jgi:hypothetical protein